MNREKEQQLARRSLEQYAAGTTTLGSAEATSPVTRYTDADRFALEMDRIHRRMATSVGDVVFTRDEDGAE